MERQRSLKSAPAKTKGPQRGEPRFAMGTVETPPARHEEPALREEEVAQIVHDLRDPLATIALETYVLDRKLAIGDHSDARSTVARIIRNVEFLDRLVQNLLDACAQGDEPLVIHRKPTELRSLIGQVLDRATATSDRGRVILEAPYPITLPVDELAIERVVANLVGNALKHTPKSGVIVVRLEAVALAAQITVTDAGPGIPASEIERVFDKYHHGPSSHGVGLGLYVCRKIVEAHGGRIGVDSIPGAGSRFYFELPATSM